MMRLFIYGILSILLFNQIANADIVVLSSGERLEVTIIDQDETSITVHHEILGEFQISTDNISAIEQTSNRGQEETTQESEINSIDEPATEHKWNQNVRLGLGFHKGQKEATDISTSYHADKTEDGHKITFDVSYRLSESDSEKTTNRFASKWGNTWVQEHSPWNIFTTLQFDWAEFQSWDQRIVGDLGVEYEILKKEQGESVFTFSARLGSGFRKEFQSDDDGLIPEGLIGILIDWSISEKQSFSADSTWFPDYKNASDYRLVTNANWNLRLDATKKLQFSVGFHHEYNSVVDPGISKSDVQLTAGVTYAF